jgi:hypothetical protein
MSKYAKRYKLPHLLPFMSNTQTSEQSGKVHVSLKHWFFLKPHKAQHQRQTQLQTSIQRATGLGLN